MVATYLDTSSYGSIGNVVSALNSTVFDLGDGIIMRSATINDQTTVFRDVSDPSSNSIISDSSDSVSGGLTDKNAVIYFLLFYSYIYSIFKYF